MVCLDGLDTGGGKALPWPACVMATAIGWISFVEWIDKREEVKRSDLGIFFFCFFEEFHS